MDGVGFKSFYAYYLEGNFGVSSCGNSSSKRVYCCGSSVCGCVSVEDERFALWRGLDIFPDNVAVLDCVLRHPGHYFEEIRGVFQAGTRVECMSMK